MIRAPEPVSPPKPSPPARRLTSAGDGPQLSGDDLTRALGQREALRAMLLANASLPLEEGAVDAFNAAAGRALPAVRAEDANQFGLLPTGGRLERAIGRLLSIVLAARENNSWSRLKACAGCRRALYDRTKNRSARLVQPEQVRRPDTLQALPRAPMHGARWWRPS